jgi:hydroxyacylglutathione hydrolase
MILKTLVVDPLEVNCYLIGDTHDGPVGIVDPGGDADRILDALKKLDRPVSFIVNTHGHFDHVGAVTELMQSLKSDYLIHKKETDVLANMSEHMQHFGFPGTKPPVPTRFIEDGDILSLGKRQIHVLLTPGHSPGGICLYCQETGQLISGDTLFRESVGRTDLPGGHPLVLLESIAEKLMVLPEETRVFPGHGPGTTIKHELRNNPFL